jgi:cation diffusion facilitator family transporter
MSGASLSSSERNRKVRIVLGAVLAANWAVALAKLVAGVSSGLASVTADGLHSFIDGGSNVLGLVAMSIAAQPADENHPYGHGKFEALASLGIGAMVGTGMIELGRMAFDSLLHGRHATVDPALFVVLIATLVVNLAVTHIERGWGERLRSPILLADARHTLSDVFVSLAVICSAVGVRLGIPHADGVVALLVLGLIAWAGWSIVRQAIGILSDTAQLPKSQVVQLAREVSGVVSAGDIRSRGMEESIWVDLTIQVDPSMTTAEAHAVAHEVEDRLKTNWPRVVDVVVHIEPAGASSAA